MPLLAVAEHLKQRHPGCVTVYVGERGGKFGGLTERGGLFDERHRVFAGKFRRYGGLTWWQKALDVKTIALNVRDAMYTVIGVAQAWWLLRQIRPDVVFLKGGFVGVPIGLAAAVRRIPIITHDSDAVPGLANRIVSRWVTTHAVALSPTQYPYPKAKTVQVGVLVEAAYQPVTPTILRQCRRQLDMPLKSTVLLVTGGSQGAVAINKAIHGMVDELLSEFPHLYIIHQVGKGNQSVYEAYQHDRLRVLEFLQPMHAYMAAADVVVARASANTIAELGVQGKAAVVVPSPYLASGHQLKNAQALAAQGSAVVVEQAHLDDSQHGLASVLRSLLTAPDRRHAMAEALQKHTIVDAAEKVSDLLVRTAQSGGGNEIS